MNKSQMPASWFNMHGLRLYLTHQTPESVTFSTKTVTLKIIKLREPAAYADRPYRVEWGMTHEGGGYDSGHRRFSKEMVERAFTTLEKDDAEPGYFIRSMGWLKIPCLGTNSDGEPNVSLFLSDENRAAVKKFLES